MTLALLIQPVVISASKGPRIQFVQDLLVCLAFLNKPRSMPALHQYGNPIRVGDTTVGETMVMVRECSVQ